MITFPKTTYTFSAYTYDENTESTDDVRVEFTASEVTASDLEEKIASFLRASGFSWVGRVDILSFDEVQAEDGGYADDGYSEEDLFQFQNEIDESQIELNFGEQPQPFRVSIDDATPEEWDAVNRKIMNYTTK